MPYDSTEIILRLDANSRALEDVRALAHEAVGLAGEAAKQGKLTNGRVSDLEVNAKIEAALSKQLADLSATHRRKWEFWRPAAAATGSGVLLLLGQHFIH